MQTTITPKNLYEGRNYITQLSNGRDYILLHGQYSTENAIFYMGRRSCDEYNYAWDTNFTPGLYLQSCDVDCDGQQPPMSLDESLAVEFITEGDKKVTYHVK